MFWRHEKRCWTSSTCLERKEEIQLSINPLYNGILYSSDKQKLTVVVHRCCNLPMEPDDPEELPDPYGKCYLNPGDSDSED
ncbi:unnamed protein product [Cyprideis torosa]|uniref:Uncharacterized protein n=1 Tax=Cyprideis torosa TaxID=163714 RepID=A0A7R8ZLZ2_9CRUS|nr:unnamed protein product [Cyprideis torosa]CAG0883189.1 unnamed protein product [Cyprideis torosa]